MAEDAAKHAGPFDVRTVEKLVQLMAEHQISEIDLRDGVQRVRLRRGARQITVAGGPLPAITPTPTSTPGPTAAPAGPTKKLLEIKSETVGTFYAAPNPDSPPFVRLGSRVEANTVVGIIDVMKTMNEIQAGCAGVIAEVLVENQTAVEFGQVLFRVDPSA